MIKLVESVGARGFSVALPNLENIKALAEAMPEARWCMWVAEWAAGRTDKPAKVPKDVNGKRLSVKNSEDWLRWAVAGAGLASGRFDGAGLLLSSTECLVGLDLDHALNEDGSVVKGKAEIVGDFVTLGGYIEVSPSGRGLRQFLRGVALEDYCENSGDGLEIYDSDSDRYLTLTGVQWPVGTAPGQIKMNQEALESFITRWGKRKPEAPPPEFDADKFGGIRRNADEVLKLLRTHNKRGKLTRLLAGDIKDFEGHSEADLALCCEAAYYCRDPEVIDAVLRGSRLIRQKWDDKRGALTYGARTIKAALRSQTKNYDADMAAKADRDKAGEKAKALTESKVAEYLVGGFDDLLTIKGQIRQDAWALTELLLRDKRLLGALHWDEFAAYAVVNAPLNEIMSDRSAPSKPGRLTDDHILAFTRWLGREWRLNLKRDEVQAAVMGLAYSIRRNPVAERLDELETGWDGVPRLDNWLITYGKAKVASSDGRDITAYVQAVGARWVISAVARAYVPGAKADAMLIIQGKQGGRKSSAIRVLTEAVSKDAFREGFKLTGNKDDKVALRGRLVVEWAELSGMGRSDRNELKNFLTLQADSYRQAYAAMDQDFPRTAVFCGTTNDSAYLADPTGNRRFWPVTVGAFALEGLRRDAPLIWGEAVARYKAQERWWFDDADPRDCRLLALAEGEQAERVGGTFWSEAAAELADRLVTGRLFVVADGGKSLSEVLPGDRFSVHQMRAWLSVGDTDGGGVVITDTNWPRVTDGLRLAGWDSIKTGGVMRWFLTAERCEQIREKYGIEGPSISSLRRAKRTAKEAETQ